MLHVKVLGVLFKADTAKFKEHRLSLQDYLF